MIGAEPALLAAALNVIATDPLRATVYVAVWLFAPVLPPPVKVNAAVGGILVSLMTMLAVVDAERPAEFVTRSRIL